MKANGERKHQGVRMRVEARRARKKSNSKYPFLDLDFVDEEPLSPLQRMAYGIASLGCVVCAIIGAVFPVLPAIPFWILAVVCLSHAFPGFGRFVRNTRLYKWLIEKLNEPETEAKRPVMLRRKKDLIITSISVGLVALWLVCFFVLPLEGYMWIVSTAITVIWSVAWFVLYIFVREPEATIKTYRKATRPDSPNVRRKRVRRVAKAEDGAAADAASGGLAASGNDPAASGTGEKGEGERQ